MPFLLKLCCVQILGVVFSSVESDAIAGTVMIEGTGGLNGVVNIFAARRRTRIWMTRSFLSVSQKFSNAIVCGRFAIPSVSFQTFSAIVYFQSGMPDIVKAYFNSLGLF
jgi:hypothetical protein